MLINVDYALFHWINELAEHLAFSCHLHTGGHYFL
ncbi:UNVERIFIED_CONTAM: hypothetical protein ABIC26_004121 [Paenibacillus sp. PvR008]